MTGAPRPRGTLIAVVGPSGVGKDSVMDALGPRLGLARVRRVITRPAALGGEDFVPVDVATFERQRTAGHFALHWGAHGLRYGIPTSIDDALAAGESLLANLSRGVLAEAAARYDPLCVLNLTATPDTLARRLAARRRESAEQIAHRLARDAALPPGLRVITVSNDGPLAETVAACAARLAPYLKTAPLGA
jgi:ribose 1,5-bisphosphokinase